MVGSPKGSGGTVFLAFHVNCPNRYLSEESINTARENLGSSPTFILGRIIMIEQHVATEVCGGTTHVIYNSMERRFGSCLMASGKKESGWLAEVVRNDRILV